MFDYMKRGPGFYREVVRLAVPLVLQNLITNSLALLDTLMVGMLGEAPMAAVTLANTPIFVIQLMIFGFQSGSSVLIAQFYGKGDERAINQVMGVGMYVSGAVTLAFGCVMCFLPEQFMSLFGNDPGVIALAAQYARYAAFSFLFDALSQLYIAAHRSMGNPKLGLYILCVSMVSNTFLNYVLIFGKLGIPAMGVAGAALGTTLSRVLEFAIVAVHIAAKGFKLRPAQLLRPSREILRKYVKYATPVVLNETLWGLGNSLYATIMGHMEGSQAILAAYGLASNIDNVATVAVFGIAATAAILIGREIGAGRRESAYQVGLVMNTLAFLLGLGVGLAMIAVTYLFLAPMVYPLFSLSPEASDIATMMLLMTYVSLSLRSFNSTNVVGVLRGGGDVRAASVIDLSPMWLIALPLAALSALVFHWGIGMVYFCRVIDNGVKFFLGLHRLRSGKWVKDVTAA